MEHHSNIVPWQMLAQRVGAVLKYIPLKEDGTLDLEVYDSLLSDRTRLVSVVHVSNALGVVNPVETIIQKAKKYDALVFLDAAQSAPHLKVDVQALDVDFLAFSAHKLYGPTGVGILYGKEARLEALPPYMGGGEMIHEVKMEGSTYAGLPFKFEAGTPHIEGNIVLKTALDFMEEIGREALAAHEQELLSYGIQKLSEIEAVKIYAKDAPRSGGISFNINVAGVHSSDVGMILDKMGIAVRTGHHCTQPIMQFFGIPGTVRASFACYNTTQEVDALLEGVKKANMDKPVKKIEAMGNKNILLTERGYVFGYNDLIVDPRSFYDMRQIGYPVIFDITHSIRKYGIPSSDPNGGLRQYLPTLGRAGVAAGIDGLFIEAHPDPSCALCDAASQYDLYQLEEFLKPLIEIHELEKKYRETAVAG
ncbi:unnamed protein product [Cyprideis torosa]|uniref:cysteine desulfurase n=1 Tax=Cyprideis torosa TaxID=163714 RepID=A0A7R8WP04_9CRUS|nr:unnamed protein product [Cyprideis torosa]CAG0904589.1 unnamed protein product [Cyprideis torosa]